MRRIHNTLSATKAGQLGVKAALEAEAFVAGSNRSKEQVGRCS
jgi:hypothetical protein